jgi:23S rRNA-/tRNA-specific pseudouridylate synthase
VHRLDKDTSGVLLLARTKEMAQIFAKYFSEPEKYIKKIYVGMLLPDSNDETVLEKDCGVVKRIETGIFNMNLHGKEKQRLTMYDSEDPFTNTGEKVEKAITDYVYVGSSKKMVNPYDNN